MTVTEYRKFTYNFTETPGCHLSMTHHEINLLK